MASTYSSNLKIELMAAGEQNNTWGATTNVNLGTALEEAIVGYGNPNFASDANLTLTLANSNSAQTARNFVLNVTSSLSLTSTWNLVVPTSEKPYIIQNNTTGGQSIVVKTASGTGVTVPNGKSVFVYTDGTNVVSALNYVPALAAGAFTGPLTGNVTGNVTGNLTGNVTGNVTGNLTGNVTGNTSGSAGSLATTNWTVVESGGVLYFKYGGVNKASLDSSGNLTVIGNVTAYGTVS